MSASPALVIAFSTAGILFLSISSRDLSHASTLGETETQQETNTYDSGYHDGSQAATQATVGQAQAAAASTVSTSSDDEEEDDSGCS